MKLRDADTVEDLISCGHSFMLEVAWGWLDDMDVEGELEVSNPLGSALSFWSFEL